MGYGRSFVCSKCQKEYIAGWGVGFLFTQEYKKTLSDIRKGKYGDKMKSIARDEKYIAVDAEDYLYVCKKCRAWKVEKGLSLYAPKNVELLLRKRYGIKTVEGWGEVPYVTGWDLHEDYRLIKRYVHKCDKCRGVMHRATGDEEYNLSCPKCGGAPDHEGLSFICWD